MSEATVTQPSTAAGTAGGPGRGRSKAPMPKGFWVLWVTVVIDMIGLGIAFPVLGPYARDRFGATGFMVGLIGAAFSIGQFVMAPVLGRLSDRFGRKPVLVVALLGTAVASFFTAFARSAWWLFGWRLFDGSSGATIGVANSVVADISEPQSRAPLMGLMGAAFGIGFSVGPAIGSLANWLGGVRAPFLLTAALALCNAVATVVRLPETRHLAKAQAASAEPGTMAGSLKDRRIRLLVIVGILTMLAFAGFEQTYSIFAESRLGLTTRTIGFTLAIVGVVLMVVQGGLIRPVRAKFSDAAVARAGLVGVTVGFALMALSKGWTLAVPAIVVIAVGQGFMSPTLNALVSNVIDPARRGRVLGQLHSVLALARIAGPISAGWMFDHVAEAAPFVAGAVFYGVAVVLVGMGVRAARVLSPASR